MSCCRSFAERSSGRLEVPVGWWARLKMLMHCRRCPPCAVVYRNFKVLRDAARRAGRDEWMSDVMLDEDSRTRMRVIISNELKAGGTAGSTPADV